MRNYGNHRFRKKLLEFLNGTKVVVEMKNFQTTWGRYVFSEVNDNRYLTRTSDGFILLIITASNVFVAS